HVVVVRDREEVEAAQFRDRDLLAGSPAERVRLVGSGIVVAGPAPDVVGVDGVAMKIAVQPHTGTGRGRGMTDPGEQGHAGADEGSVAKEVSPGDRHRHWV